MKIIDEIISELTNNNNGLEKAGSTVAQAGFKIIIPGKNKNVEPLLL